MTTRYMLLAACLVLSASTGAGAQDKKVESGTGDLNRAAAAASAAQNAANANSAAQYQSSVDGYQAARSGSAEAQAAYDAAVEAHRQQQAAYDAAYAAWQADVAACTAGDRARCAKPAPQS